MECTASSEVPQRWWRVSLSNLPTWMRHEDFYKLVLEICDPSVVIDAVLFPPVAENERNSGFAWIDVSTASAAKKLMAATRRFHLDGCQTALIFAPAPDHGGGSDALQRKCYETRQRSCVPCTVGWCEATTAEVLSTLEKLSSAAVGIANPECGWMDECGSILLDASPLGRREQ